MKTFLRLLPLFLLFTSSLAASCQDSSSAPTTGALATSTSTVIELASPSGTPSPQPTPTETRAPTATPSATATSTVTPRATSAPDSAYRILFVRDGGIWVTDLNGQSSIQLTKGIFYESRPYEPEVYSWVPPRVSPDGRYVIAASSKPGTWLLRTDGSESKQISPVGFDSSWSPDSRAFTYHIDGTIYVRGLDSRNEPMQIARGLLPTWSPNGQWIAFRGGYPVEGPSRVGVKLMLAHPDGSGLLELDRFEIGARMSGWFELQWSFDGRYVLAWGDKPKAARLWYLAPSGNRLTEMSAVNMLMSPSGPYLYLEDWYAIEDRVVKLAEPLNERAEKVHRCSWGSWTMDRTRIACSPGGYGNRATYAVKSPLLIIDLESGETTVLSVDLPNLESIRWLPDGDSIFVSSGVPPNAGTIRRVRVDGSAPPQLITQGYLLDVFVVK